MPRTLFLSLLLTPFLAVAPALAAPIDLVRQAVQAEGGAAALKALQRLQIEGEAHFYEPDESKVPGGAPSDSGLGQMVETRDLAGGMAKTQWARDQRYPNRANAKQAEIVTAQTGFVQLASGPKPMSGIRVAAAQRELERSSPWLLVKALEAPKSLSAMQDQRLAGASYPAVAFKDGRWRFILLFDRKSHLPVAVRTRDEDGLRGDQNFDLVLGDWQPVAGAMMAHALSYRLGSIEIEKASLRVVKANPDFPAGSFTVPDAIRNATKPPAGGTVPYQWVIRRINQGFFNDSDAVTYDPATSKGLTLTQLAPNIQQVVGGSHNSLIVGMKNFTVVVDAPINDDESNFIITAAKQKFPGKPIKYIVLTHHHMDHTSGVRPFLAEGATLVVGKPAKPFFEMVAKAPHRILPDALQKHPRPVKIVEVADRMSIKDGAGGEVRLYRIDNPHADGMLLVHEMSKNLIFVTDLYSPGRDKTKNPNNLAVRDALQKLGVQPAMFAGGHGSSGDWAAFQQVVSQ
jgi:glyoxylase-like metal-dependent hydrolase (beta-lactamase superfamily II)